jgi:hypothetical protein
MTKREQERWGIPHKIIGKNEKENNTLRVGYRPQNFYAFCANGYRYRHADEAMAMKGH